MNDDLVLVIDRPAGEVAAPRRRPVRSGGVVATGGLAMLAAVVSVMVASAGAPSAPEGPVGAAGLDAPEDPAVPPVVPAAATGWRGARMPGQGVVSVIAAGPDGWLAAIDDSEVPALFTSPDAVLWFHHTFPAPAPNDPVATVGDGWRMVAGGHPDRPGSSLVVTSVGDGGWSSSVVDGVEVAGLDAVGGTAFLHGTVPGSEVALMRADPGPGGRVEWKPVPLPGAAGIAGVVDDEGRATVLGWDARGWAVWLIGGAGADHHPAEVPAGVTGVVPLDVVAGPDGAWRAAAGEPAAVEVGRVLISEDLRTWRLDGGPLPAGITGIAAGHERMLAWGAGTPLAMERSWEGWRVVSPRYREVSTGIEDLGEVASIDSRSRVVVVGGLSASGKPAVWVNGTAQPVAVPPGGSPQWEVAASTEAAAGSELGTVARRGEEVFIGSSAYVWRATPDGSGHRQVAPTLLAGSHRLVEVGDEVFAVAAGAGGDATVVYRYHKDSVWERERVPIGEVAAVSLTGDGSTRAIGSTDGRQLVAERHDREWRVVGRPDVDGLTGISPVPGGFIGRAGGGGAFSSDGLRWELDARFAEPGGPGFAVVSSGPASTELLLAGSGWSEAVAVDVPATGVRRAELDGAGSVWVEAPGEVLVGGIDGPWRRMPVSVTSGVVGTSWVLLPAVGGDPAIAVIDGRRLEILDFG